jgi:ribosomal protein L22
MTFSKKYGGTNITRISKSIASTMSEHGRVKKAKEDAIKLSDQSLKMVDAMRRNTKDETAKHYLHLAEKNASSMMNDANNHDHEQFVRHATEFSKNIENARESSYKNELNVKPLKESSVWDMLNHGKYTIANKINTTLSRIKGGKRRKRFYKSRKKYN